MVDPRKNHAEKQQAARVVSYIGESCSFYLPKVGDLYLDVLGS